MKKAGNLDLLDLLKLILSCMVVMIHTTFLGPYNAYIYPAVRFAVPMFFMMTGYFSFRKIDSLPTFSAQKKAVGKIVIRLLKLYLFWFVVLLPYTLYVRKYFAEGFGVGLLKMLRGFLFGSTFTASWYLMACVLGILIVFFLSRKCSSRALLWITVPVYLFATLVSVTEKYILASPSLNAPYQLLLSTLGYPYMGFLICLLYITLGKRIAERAGERRTSDFLWLLCSLALLLAERWILGRFSWFNFRCDSCFFLAPATYYLLSFLMSFDVKISCGPVLRSISTIIYCSHGIVMALVSKLIPLMKLEDPYNIWLFLLTVGISALCGLVILTAEHRGKGKIASLLAYSH